MFIIAGPNGAGKTTASMEYLKYDLDCLEFINADNIAVGISPFQPEKVSVTAGKIMLNRIDELIESGNNFAIESTLSSKLLADKCLYAKKKGFEIIILFYWLESSDLAVERVEHRVSLGGHNIPVDIIKRRYERGLKNLFQDFMSISDYWLIVNNSGLFPSNIAEGNKYSIKVFNEDLWDLIKGSYGKGI
ncbi:MAG: zeta toxin [Candidatus Kapabacteria bacterium]|nr:zeta toxin [Candidatus Kapabacteria bacterium]